MRAEAINHPDIVSSPLEQRSGTSISEAHIVGKRWGKEENMNWSLKDLYKEKLGSPMELRLRQLANALGVQELYAPEPDFGGTICGARDFPNRRFLGDGVHLYTGVTADGMRLPKGAAKLTPTGGCGEFIASDGALMVSMHLGFRSVFRHDELLFAGGIAAVTRLFSSMERVRTWYRYSIRPDVFTHPITSPQYGERNRALITLLRQRYPKLEIGNEGAVDMPSLVRLECILRGLPPPTKDKWSYLPSKNFVHTRLKEPDRQMRNLVVIVRK